MKKQLILSTLLLFGICNIQAETPLQQFSITYHENLTLCDILRQKHSQIGPIVKSVLRNSQHLSADDAQNLIRELAVLGKIIVEKCGPFLEAVQEFQEQMSSVSSCLGQHSSEYCDQAYFDTIAELNEAIKPIVR